MKKDKNTNQPDEKNIGSMNFPAKGTKSKRLWLKWAGAVCLGFAVLAVVTLAIRNAPAPDYSSLPVLDIRKVNSFMGAQMYAAYDVSEIISGNPWTKNAKLTTLPVYENTIRIGGSSAENNWDTTKMYALLLDLAERAGIDTAPLKIPDDTPERKAKAVIQEKFAALDSDTLSCTFTADTICLTADGVRITVYSWRFVSVSFDPPKSLPAKYNLTRFASYKETKAAANYLKKEYKTLLGMANPQTSIQGFGYNTQQRQRFYIIFYDGGGTLAERMVNYSYFNAEISSKEEESAFLGISFYAQDLSNKVGDYPLISIDEAIELLDKGHYTCSSWLPMPGSAYIRDVELLYEPVGMENYLIPFYRFLVEYPDDNPQNDASGKQLKTYGAYHVPAIESRFIKNLPVDGSFID